MDELRERLRALAGKWIARAEELEAELERQRPPKKPGQIFEPTPALSGLHARVTMYRSLATQLAAEAGFTLT